MDFMNIMTQICGLIVCLFVGALGLAIVIKVFTGSIDLTNLINEGSYGASMSRFQFLIFTFVIAIAFFKLVEKNDKFPDVPNGVLTLLGISASTYAVGKGLSSNESKNDDSRGGDGSNK
jgi:hypothetical protein